MMKTSTVGRWLIVNHKHDDYASTALTLVIVTNTTRLYRGEKEKEILFFVCDFFQFPFNVKIHVQLHYTVASQFYVHVNVELFIHAFIHFTFR